MSLTLGDVFELQSMARTALAEMPARGRFKGMARDLSFDERLMVAAFEASLSFLNRNGAVADAPKYGASFENED